MHVLVVSVYLQFFSTDHKPLHYHRRTRCCRWSNYCHQWISPKEWNSDRSRISRGDSIQASSCQRRQSCNWSKLVQSVFSNAVIGRKFCPSPVEGASVQGSNNTETSNSPNLGKAGIKAKIKLLWGHCYCKTGGGGRKVWEKCSFCRQHLQRWIGEKWRLLGAKEKKVCEWKGGKWNRWDGRGVKCESMGLSSGLTVQNKGRSGGICKSRVGEKVKRELCKAGLRAAAAFWKVRGSRPRAGRVKDAGILQDGQVQKQAHQVRAEAQEEATFRCFRRGGRGENINLKLNLLTSISVTTWLCYFRPRSKSSRAGCVAVWKFDWLSDIECRRIAAIERLMLCLIFTLMKPDGRHQCQH